MKRTLLLPARIALAQLDCGHSSGDTTSKKTGSTAPPSTTLPPGAFAVGQSSPASAPATTTKSLTITFTKAVDPNTVVDGTTFLFVEDDDTTPAGNFSV